MIPIHIPRTLQQEKHHLRFRVLGHFCGFSCVVGLGVEIFKSRLPYCNDWRCLGVNATV